MRQNGVLQRIVQNYTNEVSVSSCSNDSEKALGYTALIGIFGLLVAGIIFAMLLLVTECVLHHVSPGRFKRTVRTYNETFSVKDLLQLIEIQKMEIEMRDSVIAKLKKE